MNALTQDTLTYGRGPWGLNRTEAERTTIRGLSVEALTAARMHSERAISLQSYCTSPLFRGPRNDIERLIPAWSGYGWSATPRFPRRGSPWWASRRRRCGRWQGRAVIPRG